MKNLMQTYILIIFCNTVKSPFFYLVVVKDFVVDKRLFLADKHIHLI